MTKPLAVVAVGGNALISDDQHMALSDQYNAVCATAVHVAAMIGAGWNVVLTHGNGPQVGFILRRSEIADGQVPTVPVQYAVGDTQGAIGFMFQNALSNALLQRGLKVPVVTLVTQRGVLAVDDQRVAADRNHCHRFVHGCSAELPSCCASAFTAAVKHAIGAVVTPAPIWPTPATRCAMPLLITGSTPLSTTLRASMPAADDAKSSAGRLNAGLAPSVIARIRKL